MPPLLGSDGPPILPLASKWPGYRFHLLDLFERERAMLKKELRTNKKWQIAVYSSLTIITESGKLILRNSEKGCPPFIDTTSTSCMTVKKEDVIAFNTSWYYCVFKIFS